MPTLNKLEYLDETKGQIKDALNTNFNSGITEEDTFRSYVSKISDIYTNWPKVTGENTSLSLSPTKKGLIALKLKGNGGKNLFDKSSGIVNDRTYDTDGSIIYQGGNSISETYINVIPSDYYTISGTLYAVVCEYDENKNFIGRYGNLNQNVLTRKASDNTYYIRIKFQTPKLDTVQVERGNQATSYEPYGASVTGDNTIKVEGKNLANVNIVGQVPSITNGQMVGSGGASCTDFIEIDNTKEMVFSFNFVSDTQRYVLFYDTYKNYLGYSIGMLSNWKLSTNPNYSNTKYVRLRFDSNAQIIWTQLEYNSTATTYTPYVSQTYPINLSTTKLNTGDSIDGEIDSWEIVRADTTTEEITDTTLITQLNNFYGTNSYDDTTNISQTNDDLGFIISASALMKGGN